MVADPNSTPGHRCPHAISMRGCLPMVPFVLPPFSPPTSGLRPLAIGRRLFVRRHAAAGGRDTAQLSFICLTVRAGTDSHWNGGLPRGHSLEWRSAPGRNGHFNHRPGAGLPVGPGPLALAGPSALGRRNAVHEPQRRAELRLPPGRARPANSRAASHGPLPRFQSKSRPGPGPAASRTGLPSRTIDAARTVTVHLTRTDSDRC